MFRSIVSLFGLFSFCLFAGPAAAHASIHPAHAWNKMVGEYRLTIQGPYRDNPIAFSIDNKGDVQLTVWGGERVKDTKDVGAARFVFTALRSDLGPDGLAVGTIVLQSGSDEQTYTYHLRVSVSQSDRKTSKLVLLDALFTENDGPNEQTLIRKVRAKLEKKSKYTGRFEEI